MRILILYYELAEYILVCLNSLAEKYECEIHVIRRPVNQEAPFEFTQLNPKIKLYNRADLSENNYKELLNEINPQLIFCGGWSDKLYLKIVKDFHTKSATVLAFDNWWTGSLKQRILSLGFKLTYKKHFQYAFIPGLPQQKFAEQLGFGTSNIRHGVYTANFPFFNNQYNPQKVLNRRFIYVGRYYDFKGIEDLWTAFVQLQNESPNDWELWCLGTGSIEPLQHPKIKHFGFVQPKEMPDYLKQTDVFVLPSRFEPWAVVVQEFAAAGFPLLLSKEVGAASAFLKENENGFSFEAGNIKALKEKMRLFMNAGEKELSLMITKSVEVAKQFTPEKWADTIYNLIKK